MHGRRKSREGIEEKEKCEGDGVERVNEKVGRRSSL